MNKAYVSILVALLLTIGMANNSNATTFNYIAAKLTDVTTGEDLWEYSYTANEHTFSADTGFTIYFDLGPNDLLDPFPAAPNTDRGVLTWNPDPSLLDDSTYDANVLVDNAFLADMFTVSLFFGGDYTDTTNTLSSTYSTHALVFLIRPGLLQTKS